MDDITKDEDILAVATGLSEDLSNIAASVATEESVNSDESTENVPEANSQEEAVETTESEENVVADENKETSADDSEEAEVQNVDSENAEKPEESLSEDSDDEVQEAVEKDNDLSDLKDNLEQDLIQLNNKVKLLEEENARLKGALHMTLVERVVDTKIALGVEPAEGRESLVAEHAKRTASSLADSLRDLAKTPVKVAKRISNFLSMPNVASEAEVVNTEDNVVTFDSEEQAKPVESPANSFEQVLVDALMGRRKL
jgi:hypothetical protein